MLKSKLIWGGIALIILFTLGFGGWMLSLPGNTTAAMAPPIPQSEADALLTALKPGKRQRPLIAVIGINDATETTDYLMPTGILRRAGVADVMLLATNSGPVQLYPALKVVPDATVAAFDAAHPEGADYVIVPAMSRDDDPAVMAWLNGQAARGAMIIGVCAGAKVVGAAGLLDGKRATTHWYYLNELLKRHPTIEYAADRRMVSDAGVTTTTGISASMPLALTLIEAIAGRSKAQAVANDIGVDRWDARHASDAFQLTRSFATTVLANRMNFWGKEKLGIPLEPDLDEVSLALAADGWSRTYRSSVTTFAHSSDAVKSRHGVRIIPDRSGTNWPADQRVPFTALQKPADALDQTLSAVTARYGERTANVVAMQLEYPGKPSKAIYP
ncbi:MAG: DJ-1/PfpI family protein [Ottowia sp.]|uniref:DJ-1/PfpI family protein n=1 Tax=unclassified Ottowia TaxID=2645081 RepID=UPI003C2E6B42